MLRSRIGVSANGSRTSKFHMPLPLCAAFTIHKPAIPMTTSPVPNSTFLIISLFIILPFVVVFIYHLQSAATFTGTAQKAVGVDRLFRSQRFLMQLG